MPYVAGSLSEAIAVTNAQASTQFGTPGRLLFYITTFNSLVPTVGWPGNFDKDSEKERTVRSWIVESLVVQNETPITVGDVQQTQDVVNVACRVMYAAQAAAAAVPPRISPAQEAAVLTAWNNSFGAVP